MKLSDRRARAIRVARHFRAPYLALSILAQCHLAAGSQTTPPTVGHTTVHVKAPRIAPPTVEPLVLKTVPRKDAVAINASTPFSRAPNPPAPPFNIPSPSASDRAIDCLTAAVYYEAASEGADGQKAVAQVVVNRLRHPAFPKTVCSVVFQGSDRSTGCQFTFTCDGALTRKPLPAAWIRARQIARSALTGKVFRPVGFATHYHTREVVPDWRTRLDKITIVGTQIFYRWPGWWGTAGAFRGTYSRSESRVQALAALSTAHATSLPGEPAIETANLATPAAIVAAQVGPAEQGRFFVALDKAGSPEGYVAIARETCGDRLNCVFLGWTDPSQRPQSTAVSPRQQDSISFSYLRQNAVKDEKALWNCREFKNRDIRTCMKVRLLVDVERVELQKP